VFTQEEQFFMSKKKEQLLQLLYVTRFRKQFFFQQLKAKVFF